ncbi:MAG: hypothetical protein JWO12_2448 [Frankiales bacterium]|nr:hypothetical protein [Frankiales bacterium]
MIRRTVLAATALAVLGGVAAPALAADPTETNVVCVATSPGGNSPHQGVCVWVPLPFKK